MIFETKRVSKLFPLPFKKRHTDAGWDLYSSQDKWVFPFQTLKIPSNHMIDIIEDFGFVIARSNIRSKGLLVEGVIDEGYQGVISILITNCSLIPRKIKAGERICQIIYITPNKRHHNEVDEFSRATDRGTDGFGKSGNK